MTADPGRGGGTGPPDPRSDAYARRLASAAYRAERPRKAEVILVLCGERLRAAARVADLGSGTGLIKKRLEMKLDKYIYGFELDRSFVTWTRGTAAADVCRLPVADESFDFLILNHLYEHVSDQPALFGEAHRILREGGEAYVSAGNRLAVTEPHYRLPFLSWLPRRAADLYLRLAGRGRAYEGIRFRTYGRLVGMMRAAGFRVHDRTERALDRFLAEASGDTKGASGGEGLPAEGRRAAAWRLLRRLPAAPRRRLLEALSPQWFFLLEKPARRTEVG